MKIISNRNLVFLAGAFFAIVLSIAADDETIADANDIISCKIATDIARNRVSETLSGYMVIKVTSDLYDKLSHDSDMGPFIDLAKEKKGSAVVIVMPGHTGTAPVHGVVFDDLRPIGYLERTLRESKWSEKYTAFEESAVFQESPEEFLFQPVYLQADDGTRVPSFRILSAGVRERPS